MQRKNGSMVILLLLCLIGFLDLALAAQLEGLVVFSEHILLTLPKRMGQEIKVSYTANPRKIIVDSTLPLGKFAAAETSSDTALKQIRYTKVKADQFRLVLEFNYQVPDGVVSEDEDYFRLEIPKTFVDTTRRMVDQGVVYGHQRRADSFGPNVVNYLEIDLWRPIEVKLALAQNRVFGSEHVSTLGQRLGAIAAINGAFFASNGRPLGVLMIDGELISEPYANRTALGLGPGLVLMEQVAFKGELLQADGQVLAMIAGLNRPRLQDELLVYTKHYGTKTNTNSHGYEVTVVDGVVTAVEMGNSTIPPGGIVLSAHGVQRQFLTDLKVGDVLRVNLELTPNWPDLGITQIIGGGPRLVRDGKLAVNGEAERFQADVLNGRAPRTAIGITADQKLLLVTVNGRQPHISAGMTLSELGNLLIDLGAEQAMNLDGGGSTTMVIRNLVLNLPSDGKERPVSNGIVVIIDASK